MVRIKVVDSSRALGFGEKGYVEKNGKLKKVSRDKFGKVWTGWKIGTKF